MKNIEKKHATVSEIDYIGSQLSVNHYRAGRTFHIRRDVREWQEDLGWAIKSLHLEEWRLPVTVTCSGVFHDRRSCPDLSNLSKVILDALEEVSGVNDRLFRWRDGTITIDPSVPATLTLVLDEGEVIT